MATLKETAEAYRFGVTYGVVDPGRAVAWADRVIAASDTPDAAVIAVSSAWAQGVEPILSALRQVPGRAEPSTVIRLLLALVDEPLMTRDADAADHLAYVLFRIAFDEAMEGCDLRDELCVIDDAFGPADDGLYGNLDEARADLVRFVRTHRADVVD